MDEIITEKIDDRVAQTAATHKKLRMTYMSVSVSLPISGYRQSSILGISSVTFNHNTIRCACRLKFIAKMVLSGYFDALKKSRRQKNFFLKNQKMIQKALL